MRKIFGGLFLIAGIVLALTACQATPADQSAIKIVFVEGEVLVGGVPASIDMVVANDAIITTAVGASCEIVFAQRNVIRIGQNSTVSLNFSDLKRNVALEKGSLTSVLRKLDKVANGDSFTVNTPTAVAGVRGTSFCIWADAASTYVCACNGTVRTIDANGSNEEVLISKHHAARMYTKGESGISLAEAELKFHDDALVENVAARIGETVNWTVLE